MNICKLISLDTYFHWEIYVRRNDMRKISSHVRHHTADGTTIGRSLLERSPEIHNLASDRRKRVNQQKYETRLSQQRHSGMSVSWNIILRGLAWDCKFALGNRARRNLVTDDCVDHNNTWVPRPLKPTNLTFDLGKAKTRKGDLPLRRVILCVIILLIFFFLFFSNKNIRVSQDVNEIIFVDGLDGVCCLCHRGNQFETL